MNEVFKGSFISLLFKVLGIIIGYFFFIFISRFYGADALGIFSICWTILMMASVLGKWGNDTAIVRFLAEGVINNNTKRIFSTFIKSFRMVFIFSILTAATVFLLKDFLIKIFFNHQTTNTPILIVSLCIVPFSLMSFTSESFRGLKKITAYNLFQTGSIYLLIILTCFFLIQQNITDFFVLESLLFVVILFAIISIIWFVIEIKKITARMINLSDIKEISYREILKTSTPMLLTNSLYLIMGWTDILMIGAFCTDAEVGIYNAAVKTAALGSVAIAAVNSIAAPKFAEAFSSQGVNGLKKLVKQTTLLSFIASLPVFLIIFLIPGFLMHFFGNGFLEAIPSLLFLTAGQLINTISGSTLYVLNMTQKEKLARNVLFCGVLLNLGLCIILVPAYGITGAAVATMTSTIVWNSLAVIVIYKHYHFLTYPFLSLKKKKNVRS